MTNTKTIARNTGWYSLESIIEASIQLFTSIAIARTLGPSKTGYIVFIVFIASVVSSLGGFGIPATAMKYISEFLGKGDSGTARYIYWRTLMLQATLATLAAIALLVWVNHNAVGEYKLASILIVLSIWPSMVNSISAQTNAAAEDFASNVPASVISAIVYFFAIAATVVCNWGVIGIGAALLSRRIVDFLYRFFPTIKRVLRWDSPRVHSHGLSRRMIPFAWQSLVSMTVALIVWNRSEVLLLGKFCADIRQVAYYSVAFSMADQLLLGATIFGTATGATIFAQFGRDKARLPELVATAFRYLVLTSIPLHFIFVALAVPALLFVYGNSFADAAMVVTVAPLLCLPKAFLGPVKNLLESIEKQRYVIAAAAIASLIDIGVASYLIIRGYGAVGACIGSGVAQVVAVCIMWSIGIYSCKVKLPWKQFAKIIVISVLASLTAHYIAVRFTPLWAILFGGSAAVLVLLVLVYLMRVLEPEDHIRLRILFDMLPKRIIHPAGWFVKFLTRPQTEGWGTANKYPLPGDKVGISPAITSAYQKRIPLTIRQRIANFRRNCNGFVLKLKLVPVPINACLRGGDNGVPAAIYARMVGNILHASSPISEWPHVKLLQEYDRLGESLWKPENFTQTSYYKNAVLNIELFGQYFDAVNPDQVLWGAKRFAYAYRGLDTSAISADIPNYERDPYEYVAVKPIKHSACYQVKEGHHRLAIAYMKGVSTLPGLILKPPVSTPLQDLLLDCSWLKGRRELYQPVDSPELAGWVHVRRCSDRLAKMINFLRAENLMPPVSKSYLDVAAAYGWFVAEMEKVGFRAEGVERDPTSISVGRIMYGLNPEQVRRADAVAFLSSLQDKYDVTSCLSLAHHYILHRLNVSAEELLHLMDSATRKVMFFDMGECREYLERELQGWDTDHIHHWLEENTTFKRIVRLGRDEDAVPPNQNNFGRMLFACVR